MKYIAIVLFLITPKIFAQNLVGNGGDVIASEFNSIARTAVYFLKKKSLSPDDQQLVLQIEKKIDTTLVESVKQPLTLNGRDVDAINYPSINKIIISRARWEQIRLRSASLRAQIVLHEYIWIAGTDDSNYMVSTRLVKDITNDLDQNSVSTEKYQAALAEFYAELNLFRIDIMSMQTAQKTDFSVYCFAAGSLKTHIDLVVQLTQENSFWFSEQQTPQVKSGIEFLKTWSQTHANNCISKTEINFASQNSDVLKASEFAKYLIMITQFPESELQ